MNFEMRPIAMVINVAIYGCGQLVIIIIITMIMIIMMIIMISMPPHPTC